MTGAISPALVGVVVATTMSFGWAMVLWSRVAVAEIQRARWSEAEDKAFGELIRILVDTDAVVELRRVLDGLPARSQDRTVARLGEMIKGSELEQLARASVLSGVVERAIDRLTSRRWGRRLDGVVVLGALGYRYYLCPQLLGDRSPAVRLAAVRWAHRCGAVVRWFDHLVVAIEDPDGMVQAGAKDALVSGGQAIVGRLCAALDTARTPRSRQGLLAVAVEVFDPELVQVCRRYARDPDPGVRAQAVQIFGHRSVPSDELVGFVADQNVRVRRAAVKAAGDRRELAMVGPVGRALDDDDWLVRDLSGTALSELGDVGMVVLRGRVMRAVDTA